MSVTWGVVMFLIYHALNVALAIIQRGIIIRRKRTGNKKQIEHGLWSVVYCVLISPMWFWSHNWFYMGSILLPHFYFFGAAYQAIVNHNNIFYLSKTSSAITERIMVWMGFAGTEKPYLLSFVAAIYLLTKIHH